MIAHQPIHRRRRSLLPLALITLLGAVGAQAQGLVSFVNLASGVNAPVTNAVTGAPASGGGFLAQLYAGRASAPEADLVPVSTVAPFMSGAAAGYFSGGNATNTFVLPGSVGTFQVRAWSGSYASYEAAVLAAQTDGNVLLGKSLVFQNSTGISSPSTLTGLQSFTLAPLAPVPEPSPLVLLGLGLLSLYRRQRR